MHLPRQRRTAMLLIGLTLSATAWASKPDVPPPALEPTGLLQQLTEMPADTGLSSPVLQSANVPSFRPPSAMLPPTAPVILQPAGREQYAMGVFYKRGLGLPRPKGK